MASPQLNIRQGTVGPPAQGLAEHLGRTARLAAPVVVSRMGMLVLVSVDTMMTGLHASNELAYLALGSAPMVMLLLLGVGMLMGTAVMTAQAWGAEEYGRCGAIWRVGLKHALGIGIVWGVICLFGEFFYAAIGQEADLAAGAGRVLATFAWQMPALLLYVVTTMFLEALNRPLPGLVVMVVVNILNIGLNHVLIGGGFGVPAMGAVGAVAATGILRWLAAILLILYVLTMAGRDRYGIFAPSGEIAELGRSLRRIGYPMALAQGSETAAFMMIMIFAGYLGTETTAAYQICINLLSLAFMAAVGTGAATGIRVGNAVGRRDPRGMAIAGWAGLFLNGIVTLLLSVVFLTLPDRLAGFYSADPALLAVAVPAVFLCAFVLIPDGAQGVLIGALRGAGDVWVPLVMQVTAFWLLTVPIAAYMCFVVESGARGLVMSILPGVIVATLLGALRFHYVTKRGGRRI
ncbi:MATE family efflux transporter [Oceanibacterium hippocampi]|uniref:Multidrug resistance protein NorM n=1 Tax=Oceanibacterium hippocampi TaxID=745714 RepID=A0A1Y5RP21_9PROT|nr:MATE family efflux transporter [Oceanibacterium hippocampi]SLN22022.1 Multidrug resistance protein NorM [Oceanibacterium hippocampi]